MSDLTERLRSRAAAARTICWCESELIEAANEIEAKDKRIAELEAVVMAGQRYIGSLSDEDKRADLLSKDHYRGRIAELEDALQTLAWQHGWGCKWGTCVCDAHRKVVELGLRYDVPALKEGDT